jgi:hypothetical protein
MKRVLLCFIDLKVRKIRNIDTSKGLGCLDGWRSTREIVRGSRKQKSTKSRTLWPFWAGDRGLPRRPVLEGGGSLLLVISPVE